MGMSICKERLALCKAKIQKCFNAIQDFFALFRLMVDRLPQFDVECWAVMSWQSGVLGISFISRSFKQGRSYGPPPKILISSTVRL